MWGLIFLQSEGIIFRVDPLQLFSYWSLFITTFFCIFYHSGLPQIVKVHHLETMVTALVALWLTTVVLELSLVIHNPISTGFIIKPVISRPIRPLTRTEYVQNALDRAVVADYIQRQ